jgi:hypothetical protein
MMLLMLHTTWINVRFKYPDFAQFRKAIAYHAGYTEALTLLNGQRITVPRSLRTMTEEEFRLVYPAMRSICERILHDLAIFDVEERVHEMTAA